MLTQLLGMGEVVICCPNHYAELLQVIFCHDPYVVKQLLVIIDAL